jgi:hypothetical protein
MIAHCRHSRTVALSDHQRGRLTALDEEHHLTVGDRYLVLGMGIFETVLYFLVRDDTGAPSFSPAAMFDCDAAELPTSWWFSLRDGIRASGSELWNRCVAMWGYETLVDDVDHFSALGERDARALEIFEREYAKAQLPRPRR